MKTIGNILLGIYMCISVLLIFDAQVWTRYLDENFLQTYYYPYERAIFIARYINFVIMFSIALFLFYYDGYRDGKRIANIKNDAENN